MTLTTKLLDDLLSITAINNNCIVIKVDHHDMGQCLATGILYGTEKYIRIHTVSQDYADAYPSNKPYMECINIHNACGPINQPIYQDAILDWLEHKNISFIKKDEDKSCNN